MLEVRLFGPPEVRSGGEPVPLASGRAQTLLAYLVLHRGTAQQKERLADLLWPDSTGGQGRTNLRHVVHILRKTVPDAGDLLRSTQHTLAWDGGWADVTAFDQALAAAETTDGAERIARLRTAVDLYAGDLLPGAGAPGAASRATTCSTSASPSCGRPASARWGCATSTSSSSAG